MEKIIQSSLPPEKLIAALKESCPSSNWMFIPAEGRIAFLFYCRKNKLILHPVLWMRNAMRKDLYLTLNANDNGTEIKITGKYTPFFRVFAVCWFTVLVVFTGMAMAAGEFFMLAPLGLLALAAIMLLILMRRFAAKEETDIEREALRLFASFEEKRA